jgi:hypothetical protein
LPITTRVISSTTVESIRTALALKRVSRCALADHHARDLLDHLATQPPRQLAHGRLVRHTLAQPNQAKTAQMQRVRNLPHKRPVSPARALLDHHQTHEGLHRNC